jgi:hypothetical protein
MGIFNPDLEERLIVDKFVCLAKEFIEQADCQLIAHSPFSKIEGVATVLFKGYKVDIDYTNRSVILSYKGNKDNYSTVCIENF